MVFPVDMTGLHCGGLTPEQACRRMRGLPGRYDRAPLRPEDLRNLDGADVLVFPVDMTGLHCGR